MSVNTDKKMFKAIKDKAIKTYFNSFWFYYIKIKIDHVMIISTHMTRTER